MPRFDNDEYVRAQVLEAYRRIGYEPEELLTEEGSVLKKSQNIYKNIKRLRAL